MASVSTPAGCTIVIAARNAAATIARAVHSAQAQPAAEIVLVDDWSSDDTAETALAVEPRIRVVRPVEHRTLGFARQAGLEAVRSPFGLWLDADDELLPGRMTRLVSAIEQQEADAATDAVELVDSTGHAAPVVLNIPSFLRRDPRLTRLFERNYLPAPGPIGFRTGSALRIGYDPALHGSEDMDFLLRSIAAGARWCLVDEVGYRQHAHAGSLSRNLPNQREMYRRCLIKHAYETVRTLMTGAGWPAAVTAWSLASMAIFRKEYDRALALVFEAARGTDETAIAEPAGPCPLPEGWRKAFFTGTLALLMDRARDAVPLFERAEAIAPTAEGANNLGIALARVGEPARARSWFALAAIREPAYADASTNLDATTPDRITTHPLRRHAFRYDYQDSTSEPTRQRPS